MFASTSMSCLSGPHRSQLSPSDRHRHHAAADQQHRFGTTRDGEPASGYGWPGTWCDPSPRASNWRATERWTTNWFGGASSASPGGHPRHRAAPAHRGLDARRVFSGPALADRPNCSTGSPSRPGMLGEPALYWRVQRIGGLCRQEPGRPASVHHRPLDLGIKTSTPRNFAHRVSAPTSFRQVRPSPDRRPRTRQGVSLSNGPGDPATADRVVALTRRCSAPGFHCSASVLAADPGRALGRSAYKMVFGHRGINVPGDRPRHRTGRHHGTEPASHWRVRAGAFRYRLRPPRWSAAPAPTTGSSRASNSSTAAGVSVQYPRGRRRPA